MRTRLKALSKNKFFQGGVLLTASNFIIGFLNYVFNIFAARALGPSGYGEINALFSYLYIFSVPLTIVTTVMIQKIGSTSYDKVAYTHAIEIWCINKMTSWWFLFIPVLCIIPFIPNITNLSPIVGYALIPLILLGFFAAIYDGAFQGLHYFVWFSVISFIVVLTKLSGALIATLQINSLEIILIFLLFAATVKIFASKKVFDNQVVTNKLQSLSFDTRITFLLKEKQLWKTTLSLFAITLLNNADVIFVKKFFPAQDAGLYSSWSLFAKIILYAVSPLLGLGFIFFTSSEHKEKHRKTFAISLGLLGVIGLFSYLFYSFFGGFLLLSFFGKQYKDIIPLLSSASIFGILYVTILYINNFFLAIKSKLVFLLPLFIPCYLIALFLIPKNLQAIIFTNITFAVILTTISFIAYLTTFSYNTDDGNKKR